MADYFLHTFNAAHVDDSDIISVLKYPVSWARSLSAEFASRDEEFNFDDRNAIISRATLDRVTVDSFTRAKNEKKTSSALAASI